MISLAAIPSIPGMLMSMTMTSGRRSIASWIASSPEPADTTTATEDSEDTEADEDTVVLSLRLNEADR